ncbi:hypothetical protein BDV29DRAFT_172301 [Aspergillus leporis]|uniref:Uncharacterized protein n=1 Tax=Aspergillus leporis TaxID=41062 RepID=A0A5N5X355_9EURO|nr:hypothetical protein BDV29DRAFT_172301 [Aspergillus leporis]
MRETASKEDRFRGSELNSFNHHLRSFFRIHNVTSAFRGFHILIFFLQFIKMMSVSGTCLLHIRKHEHANNLCARGNCGCMHIPGQINPWIREVKSNLFILVVAQLTTLLSISVIRAMICLCDSKSQYVLAVGPSSNHNQREWACDKATPYDFAMTAFAEDNRDYLYGVGPFIGLAI